MIIVKNLIFVCLINVILSLPAGARQISGQISNFIVEKPVNDADFPIVAYDQTTASLRYDTSDYTGVIRAIGDLQSDVDNVTGVKPKLLTSDPSTKYEIVIGTLGKSKLIDKLISANKLDAKDLKGKWESFVIATIKNPKPGVNQYLVIAGSDKRGTIYGIYELSKQLGISPWYWWADVPAKKRPAAYVLIGSLCFG